MTLDLNPSDIIWPAREIRAMLRAATKARYLTGWQGPHAPYGSYTIAPALGDADEKPPEFVIGYCEGLVEAGVRPLYRASEPLTL